MQMPFFYTSFLSITSCLLFVYYVAKLRVPADNPHQRKPFKIHYLLELPSIRSFFHRDSHHRNFKARQPFCCLCVAYSEIFLTCQHFSRQICPILLGFSVIHVTGFFPKFHWRYVIIVLRTSLFLESNSKFQKPKNNSLTDKLLVLFHHPGSY